MAATHAPAREVAPPPASTAVSGSETKQEPKHVRRSPTPKWHAANSPSRAATDDEILGLNSATSSSGQRVMDVADATEHLPEGDTAQNDSPSEPENLRAAFEANPELRQAWQDAQAYRETFATPEEARSAATLLADLDRMDALFFSRRPEDHAELARAVASLDPAAFASLAQAMSGLAEQSQSYRGNSAGNHGANRSPSPGTDAGRNSHTPLRPQATAAAETTSAAPVGPTQAQADFFHAANAASVEGVLDAIESQVERLLPENVSKSARNRVIGEIYRELDATLRSNRQLAQQMRDAFCSGALDADHQRAVVSLVTGRARQALPGVAKRVLNEWTSTVVAANHDRRARQLAAERRVDIGGSGGAGTDGPRSMTARDIDYKRMSDADILNL
jgi:hypothetical protein